MITTELQELTKYILSESGLSVRCLAKKANVSPTSVQELSSGKKKDVKFSTVMKLCEAANVELAIDLIKFK